MIVFNKIDKMTQAPRVLKEYDRIDKVWLSAKTGEGVAALRQAIADFEAAVIETSQIVDAQRLFGDPDYLLHVVAADLPAFQQLYDERLTSLPNVQRLTSTLVMKRVIQDRMLPL